MGCCFGRGSTEDGGKSLEMLDSNVTNEAVLCRIGRKGDGIRVLEESKSFEVSGEGICWETCWTAISGIGR